ncbi:Putative HTH-type transcriptional regulator TrmBL2 [uncultured archaeon]|nr:Putative HTH-type transcriptional regulator TrmBL2 [uncultured archaeon]
MKQLEEVLKGFGWESYEVKAYCTLVKHGASKIKDLSFRSKVPEGKIYSVMSQLEKRGAVIKSGKRPQKYDAQNPRYLLEQEQNQLREKCGLALAGVEQAWELRNEKMEETEKVWQITGISGIFSEIRKLLETNCTSIIISAHDLEWLTSKDIDRIKKCISRGVAINVVTLNGSNTSIIHQLVDAGISVRITNNQPMNFYIFNNKVIIWICGNYEIASIIADEKMAAVLEKEFNNMFEKGLKPGSDILAT